MCVDEGKVCTGLAQEGMARVAEQLTDYPLHIQVRGTQHFPIFLMIFMRQYVVHLNSQNKVIKDNSEK